MLFWVSIIVFSNFFVDRIVGNELEKLYPAFYPCPHYSQSLNISQVLTASLTFDDNPGTYQPLSMYHVTIRTTVKFNRLETIGIMTSVSNGSSMCFPIYTHLSPQPTSQASFYWIAPPSGSGCVSIAVRSYSLFHTVLNNVILHRICEADHHSGDLRHSGDLFKEDFDSAPLNRLWSSERSGFEIRQDCFVGSGRAAVFCNATSPSRYLVTKPVNATKAETLQFLIGFGSCKEARSRMKVLYRDITMAEQWNLITNIRIPASSHNLVVDVPLEARRGQIQFKFQEERPLEGEFQGCWAIDDVILISGADLPNHIEDNMDESGEKNWIKSGLRSSIMCATTSSAMIVDASTGCRSVTTRDVNLSSGRTPSQSVKDWDAEGSIFEEGGCGHDPGKLVRVFNQSGSRTLCTGPTINLVGKATASFILSIGSGKCSKSTSHRADVKLYYEVNGEKHVMQTFHYYAYKIPRDVVVSIPEEARNLNTKLCFQQLNQSSMSNTWAIDSFRLGEEQENPHHFIQFSINLACRNSSSTVKLQYSSDLGRSWSLIRNACLSRRCFEKLWKRQSVYDVESLNQGWQRLIIPIPEAGLTSATRFRWLGHSSDSSSQWAIDDVYLGSDSRCPEMCNGRGFCSFEGCRCDDGFTGTSCSIVTKQLPSFLAEDFNSGFVQISSFEKVLGGNVGFDCGVVGSGKALVFSRNGSRFLLTQPLNATLLRFIQFTIFAGDQRNVGTCPGGLYEGLDNNGVLVQYSTNRGLTWKLLIFVEFNTLQKPKVISLDLPHNARKPGLQIRWLQTQDESSGVWAIDDVIITSSLFKTANSTSLSFELGTVRSYCGRDMVLTFPEEASFRSPRYMETESLQVSSDYVLQASVAINCDVDRNTSEYRGSALTSTTLEVQYSRNHGREWNVAIEFHPSHFMSSSIAYYSSSLLHSSETRGWRRITLPLLPPTWSDHTRFRIVQHGESNNVSWAVDDVYIGPGCPYHCRAHGDCRNGVCICDDGYCGDSCLPRHSLPKGVAIMFDDTNILTRDGWKVFGEKVVKTENETSCGPMTSSTYVHFHKTGMRVLMSPPLDLREGGQIQFYLRIRGRGCGERSNTNSSVFLQYSLNGGASWYHVHTFHSSEFSSPSYVHFYLTNEMKQSYVLLRWWQPWKQEENVNSWDIDDLIVGRPVRQNLRFRRRDVTTRNVGRDEDVIIISSSDLSDPEEFCSPRDHSFVFNNTWGARFATTDDHNLDEGDLLQFEINIACSSDFSNHSSVELQFSHDAGYTWTLLRHPIRFTDHVVTLSCSKSIDQQKSVFSIGDFPYWIRLDVLITREVAAKKVRFRWYQKEGASWALRNIYIGTSCPEICLGRGRCMKRKEGPRCVCDDGFEENERGSCSPISQPITLFRDLFDENLTLWRRISGGSILHSNNNNALCFNGDGMRLAETKAFDTTTKRLLHFRLSWTGTNLEGDVVVQSSVDGGTEWSTIKAIPRQTISPRDFELFTINIPRRAKSPFTSFRWWQPLQHPDITRTEWCLDDVIIDRANMMSNGFHDNFDHSKNATFLSKELWYGSQGARVGSLGLFFSNHLNKTFSNRQMSLLFDSTRRRRYLESWDIFLLSGSFIQFDLIMGYKDSSEEVIHLQFSTNMGRTWDLVSQPCLGDIHSPSCDYEFGSLYRQALNMQWVRHTIPLSEVLRYRTIRFRWIQPFHNDSRWAIDNIYIGNKCEWMCGGFGRCESFEEQVECRCDRGFEKAPHCKPTNQLPTSLTENFDHPWSQQGFSIVTGNQPIVASNSSQVMVSKENLRFSMRGPRLLQTRPLNTTDTRYLQFYIMFDVTDRPKFVVVQSSINNGIKWETIKKIRNDGTGQQKLVHIMLRPLSRHNTTIFRWWQLNLNPEINEAVWALDNLAIGGRTASCEIQSIQDDFESPSNSGWLFQAGGVVAQFCPSFQRDGMALVFDSDQGERFAMTRDLSLSMEDDVIQFEIATVCDDINATSHHAIRFEFSVDDGITWSLVEPHCFGNTRNQLGCTPEHHQASVYYPGSWRGWRRVTIPLLGKYHISNSGSIRFRWVQLLPHPSFSWALDNVYIGKGCAQSCSGHGYCDEGTCRCDAGFHGSSCCDVQNSLSATILESFDAGSNPNPNAWLQTTGGLITTSSCQNKLFVGSYYVMKLLGMRVLMTSDIKTSQPRFVYFYMKQEEGAESHTDGNLQDEGVLLQFSSNGGVSWQTIQVIQDLPQDTARFFAIDFPEEARSNATRLRWWQPSRNGEFPYNWSIDHVVVAGNVKEIDDDFSRLRNEIWIERPSATATHQATCCSSFGSCASLEIKASSIGCGHWQAATVGVAIGPGSYTQFFAKSGCNQQSGDCYDLVFEFSVNHGHEWSLVRNPCLPFDPQCSSSEEGSVYSSDQFLDGSRVVIILPESTWSPSTRFRWRVADTTVEKSWHIDDVYIGDGCWRACGGHGRCHEGVCECDHGWKGEGCSEPTAPLPVELKTNFEEGNTNKFSKLAGGFPDQACSRVGLGKSLHFNQSCSRVLVTDALDTRSDMFVQFYFYFACDGNPPSFVNQSVLLQYSRNGGISWMTLKQLSHCGNFDRRFVNIILPEGAKGNGVQFKWWQPNHEGGGNGDWAIDNLFIGGGRKSVLSDGFELGNFTLPFYLDHSNATMWLFYDNTQLLTYCQRHQVVAANPSGLDIEIGTKDFVIEKDYILQYSIVVGCEVSSHQRHQPVHVQYSIDFGSTWQYVTKQCLPFDRECFGKESTQPSVHFMSQDWRRRTITVGRSMEGRIVRFRWIQYSSDIKWALSHVFVGPQCPRICSGNGDCTMSSGRYVCQCEEGFSGDYCNESNDRKTFMKDSFNRDFSREEWARIDGGILSHDCDILVDGTAMKFGGFGHRGAQTEELDLRDARFVQFHIVIGSSSQTSCVPARTRSDGVLLQFSVDGGISWDLLRDLDPRWYSLPTRIYVKLPLEARTKSTTLRWWQPYVIDDATDLVVPSRDRAGWALDDIYAGGNQVNPPSIEEDFEEELGNPRFEQKFDFFPNGEIDRRHCNVTINSNVMKWPGGNNESLEQSLTSRQLIVTKGFMVQFEIVVGCLVEHNQCSQKFNVAFQHRDSPESKWSLVFEDCFPDSQLSLSCSPFHYHESTTYVQDGWWKRVTIPLDYLYSESIQFRWFQKGASPPNASWALDNIFIGEACPRYCSGHGRCTQDGICACDRGFAGHDCSQPLVSTLYRNFKDDFEGDFKTTKSSSSNSVRAKWESLMGGIVGYGGCGTLGPFGFGRSVYFNSCGKRWLRTNEMDLRRGSFVLYVIKIGSNQLRSSCHVNRSRDTSVLLQYTSNNGVTWELLKVHRAEVYGTAKRVAIKLDEKAKTSMTSLRWWQPQHGGAMVDQWALDNVEIVTSPINRYINNADLSS